MKSVARGIACHHNSDDSLFCASNSVVKVPLNFSVTSLLIWTTAPSWLAMENVCLFLTRFEYLTDLFQQVCRRVWHFINLQFCLQVAVEISTEAAVKEYVRSFYTENAVVSTRPTTEGNRAIDTFHQYAGVKWLLDKPISAYNDAQWLLIQKAEEEKLLEVTLGLREESRNKLLAECENLYLSDGVSLIAQQWNEQRKLILRDAIVLLTLPSMEKEARLVLASRAKQWLAAQCGLQLWNKVSVAPYAPGKASITDYRSVQLLVLINGGPYLSSLLLQRLAMLMSNLLLVHGFVATS